MIKVYFQAFVNFEQNDLAWLLPIAEFIYNNAKNANTGYILFELNCRYYFHIFYKEDLDPCLKLKIAKKLSFELQELMTMCQQNLYHAQKLQKQAHNKGVKSQSYAAGNKVWLNSKYFKTMRNCKLEAKFLGVFQVLYPIDK